MLQSPTTESTEASRAGRKAETAEPRRELHPITPMGELGLAAQVQGARRNGGMAALQSAMGNQVVQRMTPVPQPVLQTKLTVNKPGDSYEQEADRVADQVMRMPDPAAPVAASSASPALQRKCACEGTGNPCTDCEEEAERGNKLHRRANATNTDAAPAVAPPIVHELLHSPGQPLEASTRAFFEPRFGRDFSHVRVHTGSLAADSARSVNALAYTVNHSVAFGAGSYAPHTVEGRRLLAHELAHVVQQARGPASPASSLPAIGLTTVQAAGAGTLQRQPELTSQMLSSPEPMSLHHSVDISGLQIDDLELEIRLIQEWLSAHPLRSEESDHLHSELDRLQKAVQPRSAPFFSRFFKAWSQAKEAKSRTVIQNDKAYSDSSISRGLINIHDLAPDADSVWQYGWAANLFAKDERKLVQSWSERWIAESFDKRYTAAMSGSIYGDDAEGATRREDKNIWARGKAYGLFLPNEKARVLHLDAIGIGRAAALNELIKHTDLKSPNADRLVDEIHDFARDPAVVLLGPGLEKLLGPFGFTYHDTADAAEFQHEINEAYEKSLPAHQKRRDSNASVQERWDECMRQRSLGINDLQDAVFDPDYFHSEDEFYLEWIRRGKQFREQYKACGHSGPDDIKCSDKVGAEYFPGEQARLDAVRLWTANELEIYQGVVEGGVVSQGGSTSRTMF